MSDPVKPPATTPDPAAVWWGSQQPAQHQQQQPGADYRPFQSFAQNQQARETEWRWRYSRWTGVMYGPIPVGLIIGLPILIAFWSR